MSINCYLFGVPCVVANCCFEGGHFSFYLYQEEGVVKEEEKESTLKTHWHEI